MENIPNSQKNNLHPILVRLFFVLIFVACAGGAYLLLPEKIKKPPINNVENNSTASVNNNTNTLSAKIETKKTPTVPTEPTSSFSYSSPGKLNIATTTETNALFATIEIKKQKYPVEIENNITVYDALQKLIADKKITATMKEYAGMGYFVEELNGTKNNNQTGEYWVYYINEASAQVGISNYNLKKDDLITWKYTNNPF